MRKRCRTITVTPPWLVASRPIAIKVIGTLRGPWTAVSAKDSGTPAVTEKFLVAHCFRMEEITLRAGRPRCDRSALLLNQTDVVATDNSAESRVAAVPIEAIEAILGTGPADRLAWQDEAPRTFPHGTR